MFSRGRSSITLTRVGRHLARTVHDGLRSIVDEIESIENTREDRLITIATTSGVSTYWLMPVIGRYRQIDPRADFRLLVSHDLVNLVQQDVDLAIRYGTGNWTATTSVLLQRQQILPLCSQAFDLDQLLPRQGERDWQPDPNELLRFLYQFRAGSSRRSGNRPLGSATDAAIHREQRSGTRHQNRGATATRLLPVPTRRSFPVANCVQISRLVAYRTQPWRGAGPGRIASARLGVISSFASGKEFVRLCGRPR